MAKTRYKESMQEEVRGVKVQWWKVIWKLENRLNIRNFFSLLLENKILTWDNDKNKVGEVLIGVFHVR